MAQPTFHRPNGQVARCGSQGQGWCWGRATLVRMLQETRGQPVAAQPPGASVCWRQMHNIATLSSWKSGVPCSGTTTVVQLNLGSRKSPVLNNLVLYQVVGSGMRVGMFQLLNKTSVLNLTTPSCWYISMTKSVSQATNKGDFESVYHYTSSY